MRKHRYLQMLILLTFIHISVMLLNLMNGRFEEIQALIKIDIGENRFVSRMLNSAELLYELLF